MERRIGEGMTKPEVIAASNATLHARYSRSCGILLSGIPPEWFDIYRSIIFWARWYSIGAVTGPRRAP